MTHKRHHVAVIGGGFGGLNAVKALEDQDVDVTLVDKNNYHLFWPLLYQVAMAGLSPADITAPLRSVFRRRKNVRVLMAEVSDIDPQQQRVRFAAGGELSYDSLIVAAGFQYHFFGNDSWEQASLDLQGLDKALAIRRRILSAYERAEQESDPAVRTALLTFIIIGAGPTGVELAGSIAEMARYTLQGNFRRIDPTQTQVLLVEAADRVLPAFTPDLSAKAQRSLQRLGVSVLTGAKVLDVTPDHVLISRQGMAERLAAHTVMWAAGVRASPLGELLHQRTGAPVDRGGRVQVAADLTVPGYPNLYVIGDMAHVEQDGVPLPGLAPVAIQQGKHAAAQIMRRTRGEETAPFRYVDRGVMATIGRAAAVADIRGLHLSGFAAWLLWLFVHLMTLVGFRNRLFVFLQWAWSYITFDRGARLIVGKDYPVVSEQESQAAHQGVNSGHRLLVA